MESMVASHSSDGFHPRSYNIKFLLKGGWYYLWGLSYYIWGRMILIFAAKDTVIRKSHDYQIVTFWHYFLITLLWLYYFIFWIVTVFSSCVLLLPPSSKQTSLNNLTYLEKNYPFALFAHRHYHVNGKMHESVISLSD